jgi:CHAT domain-containing protein
LLFWNERVKTTQLPSLDLKVDLLTLSACETALGQNLGLGGAAAQSGARGVLASLWAISDAGTTPLMLSFYENLPRAKSKALALQQTQKAAIAGKLRLEKGAVLGLLQSPAVPLGIPQTLNLRHPYFWSPFVLVGNWL